MYFCCNKLSRNSMTSVPSLWWIWHMCTSSKQLQARTCHAFIYFNNDTQYHVFLHTSSIHILIDLDCSALFLTHLVNNYKQGLSGKLLMHSGRPRSSTRPNTRMCFKSFARASRGMVCLIYWSFVDFINPFHQFFMFTHIKLMFINQ